MATWFYAHCTPCPWHTWASLSTASCRSLVEHVALVSRSVYYQLRKLRPVVRCLSDDATKTLVHAFIASRLDDCNALFFGITNKLFCCLQSVQNAAARLVTGAKRSNHISPVLRQLHWLPVRQRVVFKIATLVHGSLSGHAPWYLADVCQLVTDARARQLSSPDPRTLTVHRTSSCFGYRTFAATATRVWNSLPSDLRKQTYHTPSSGGRWRHFYLDSPTTAHCELLTALFRNILT